MEFSFSSIEVGQVLNKMIGKPEGSSVDIDDAGMQIFVNFSRPMPDEIEQFKQGKDFEIKFVTLQNIIIFTFKVGNLNWMDAPYSAHLSLNLTKELPLFNEGEGLSAMLILTDAATAKVVSLRMMGLSTRFSNSLVQEVNAQKSKVFSVEDYNRNLTQIYAKYSTKDLVKMSTDRCRI